MESNTTHGTSSASMIFLATVVFPEALPPHSPVGETPSVTPPAGRMRITNTAARRGGLLTALEAIVGL